MKQFVTTLIIAFCAVMASVPAAAQFRWGPSVGMTLNDMNFKQDLFDVKSGIGGSAGIKAEMMFPGIGFGLDMGLYYEQRSTKLNLGQKLIWSSLGYGNENIWIHSIDIPFNLKFKWTRMQGLEDFVAPFVFGGPMFTIQAGHSKCDALKYSGGDVSLIVGGGFELWRRWQISASYTWGMTYALKTKLLDNYSARSRSYSVRLAYFF